MNGWLNRNSGRLGWVAGALAPVLLALAGSPTIAGGPDFNADTGVDGSSSHTGGTGSLGGWGGEVCSLGLVDGPDGVCANFDIPPVVAAVSLPPGGRVSSFGSAAVDTNLGLYFLADRTNNAISVINTRTTEQAFGLFNVPSYQTSLCINKFTATGQAGTAQNGIQQTTNNGPNSVVVVNHRTVWAGDGNSTIKVCSL